jgi:hypothetical protein
MYVGTRSVSIMAGIAIHLTFFCSSVFAEEVSSGFSIDTSSRGEVVSAWHRYYLASSGFADKWSGVESADGCSLSPPPDGYVKDIQRRVNYFRAMTGLPASIDFSEKPVFSLSDDLFIPASGTTRSEAARAAVMAHVNQPFDLGIPGSFALTHEPPVTWPCFSPSAWNGARFSNLSGFSWGCDAIDDYMDEPGYGGDAFANREVGHRRWILFSAAKEMAVGDVPPILASDGQLIRPGVNALYVIGGFTPEERPVDFVAWPNPGYTPAPILTGLWSLSYPGANFNTASVSMQDDDGNAIPLTVVSRNIGFPLASETNLPGETGEAGSGATGGPVKGIYGDSTLVWTPLGLPMDYSPDKKFQVSVTGISGSGPSSYTYDVTVINPNVLSEPLRLIGAEEMPSSGATVYHSGSAIADSYEVELSQPGDADWSEGAELDEATTTIDYTSAAYDYRSSTQYSISQFWRSGTHAFRLAFPSQGVFGARIESFELGRSIIPQSGAQLTYHVRLGLMADTTTFKTQRSVDGGATWLDLPESSLAGTFNIGSSFQKYTLSLPEAGGLTLVRFLLSKPEGASNYGVNTSGFGGTTGVFIDDISVSNARFLESSTIIPLDKEERELNINQLAGDTTLSVGQEYSLRIRPLIGLTSFAWSQPLDFVVVDDDLLTGFQKWATVDFPEAGGFLSDSDGDGVTDGLEYALGTHPLLATDSPVTSVNRGTGERPSMLIPLDNLRADIAYNAEWSRDLVSWSTDGVEVTYANGVLSALAPASPAGSLNFLRWRVSVIPAN